MCVGARVSELFAYLSGIPRQIGLSHFAHVYPPPRFFVFLFAQQTLPSFALLCLRFFIIFVRWCCIGLCDPSLPSSPFVWPHKVHKRTLLFILLPLGIALAHPHLPFSNLTHLLLTQSWMPSSCCWPSSLATAPRRTGSGSLVKKKNAHTLIFDHLLHRVTQLSLWSMQTLTNQNLYA